jgi:quercetin dioxygenase-like cupin family protein
MDQPPIAINSDLNEIVQFAESGIVSKQVATTPEAKYILFCLDKGQELSEHTASVPAAFLILEGEADVEVGDQAMVGRRGLFVHMPASTPHSLHARERLVFLLTMYQRE